MTRETRVLVLLTQLDRGGAETVTMNYYRHMDHSKVQYDFLVNRPEKGAYEEEIHKLGGHVYHMCPMYPQKFSQYKREFRNFLQSHPEYRIIHSNLEERSYFPLRIAAEEGVPVRIAHAHNEYHGFDKKTLFRDYFKYRLPPYITHAFACSKKAGNWLFGKELMESGNVRIIPNAVDSKLFSYNSNVRETMRAELNLGNKLTIGNVARLTKQKNQSFLLAIFAELKKIHPNSELLLVGDGELKEKLKEQATRLGILDDIQFTGVVSNVSDYLQAMDLFLLPSLHEGLPLSLVEAESADLPCVTSDVVTNEADIQDMTTHLSLETSPTVWAHTIYKIWRSKSRKPRKDITSSIRDAHFDIIQEAHTLQNFYLKNLPASHTK